MSPQVIALGELLVEIMRPEVDQPLSRPGAFVGPFPSGAPAIFIDAVARLGASTGFIGVVGGTEAGPGGTAACPDAFGACVLDRLRDDGVDITHVRVAPGYTTGAAFVAYRGDGSRHFVFHLPHSAAALLGPEDVDPAYVAGARFLHVTGSALSMGEPARQACYRAVRLCKAAGGRVSFDPNLRPELIGLDRVREICQPVLACCDLLLPSGPEATMLATTTDNTTDGTTDRGADRGADEDAACRELVGRGIPLVALKRGAKGSTVYAVEPGSGEVVALDAPPLSVREVDPTGAGDCYGAAFVAGLLEGWPLARVARFANVAGALAVTRQGPMEGAPHREDVLAYM